MISPSTHLHAVVVAVVAPYETKAHNYHHHLSSPLLFLHTSLLQQISLAFPLVSWSIPDETKAKKAPSLNLKALRL
jgi:hypothetical protein